MQNGFIDKLLSNKIVNTNGYTRSDTGKLKSIPI